MEDPNPSSANFTIRRLEHDVTGSDVVQVTFKRTGNRPDGKTIMPMSVASNTRKLHESLLDAGADLPLKDNNGHSVDPMTQIPEAVGVLSATPGWKGTASTRWFMQPSWNCGTADRITHLEETACDKCLAKNIAGSLATWRTEVAGLAVKSPPASAALLVALASPLFLSSGLKEGFIFNIAGNGSSGKTSANSAAASVWGNPHDIASWNATQRGLIEYAAANNDMCLVLDDVEQADDDPKKRHKKVHELTHILASGSGKIYSKVVSGQDQLPKLKFRTLVLSSSPKSIEAALREGGTMRTDGDRVRLLEYQIPHGDAGGIWVGFNGKKISTDTAALSNKLVQASLANFGVAGRALVEYLVANQADIPVQVAKYRIAFLNDLGVTLGSVEGRIAEKVALLYAAGRISMKAEVLGWSKADVKASAKAAFYAVIRASNLTIFDPAKVAEMVKPIFNDQKRYCRAELANLSDFELPESADGCVHREGDRIYARLSCFTAAVEHAQGTPLSMADRDALFSYLTAKKALLAGDGNSPTKTVRFKDTKPKMLAFSFTGLSQLFNESR